MKRFLLLLALVWLALMVAVPALAQTEPGAEPDGPTTGAILAAITVFGVMVKGALAILKRHLPNVSGTVTQLAGWVLGGGISATLDYRAAAALIEQAGLADVIGRPPAPVLDYVITGFAIMAASGVIAEFVGTAGPRRAALEAQANTVVVEVDAGGNPL